MAVVKDYMAEEQKRINNQRTAGGNTIGGFNTSPVTAKQRKAINQKISAPQEYTFGADPGSYKSRYQGALDAILKQIQNPEEFKYEFNGDELFRNYADLYTQYGKQASLDTMGQAVALTGGYGNSYAQQAGQQAYQQYLLGLYDKGFDLRNMAYQGYRDQMNDLYNTYNMYAQAEAQDYARYQDAQNAYLQMMMMQPQGGGGGGGGPRGGKSTIYALGDKYYTIDSDGLPHEVDPSKLNDNTMVNYGLDLAADFSKDLGKKAEDYALNWAEWANKNKK